MARGTHIRVRMVGRHRRIRFGALLDYERQSRLARKAAIEEMVAEARRLNLD